MGENNNQWSEARSFFFLLLQIFSQEEMRSSYFHVKIFLLPVLFLPSGSQAAKPGWPSNNRQIYIERKIKRERWGGGNRSEKRKKKKTMIIAGELRKLAEGGKQLHRVGQPSKV
jgi:hypothetical protein